MVINNLKELVNLICNVAIHAGFAINKHYKKKIKVKIKKDKTPVTKADLESNSIIIKLLNKIDNNIPILSEERLINWYGFEKDDYKYVLKKDGNIHNVTIIFNRCY